MADLGLGGGGLDTYGAPPPASSQVLYCTVPAEGEKIAPKIRENPLLSQKKVHKMCLGLLGTSDCQLYYTNFVNAFSENNILKKQEIFDKCGIHFRPKL